MGGDLSARWSVLRQAQDAGKRDRLGNYLFAFYNTYVSFMTGFVADPDPRRDLGDRNAAVEIIDDQLLPLEFRQPSGARVG